MTRYSIGLVGDLDHLRPHLLGAGFDPRGGPFGHAATSEIDSLLKRDLRTPLLVSVRDGDPTWGSWLKRLLDSGARVVAVGGLPGGLGSHRCRQVRASASLSDALTACGASKAMVPEILSSVPLAAPKVDRPDHAGQPAASRSGGPDAAPAAVLDPPAAPRRSAPSPIDADADDHRLPADRSAAAPPTCAPPAPRHAGRTVTAAATAWAAAEPYPAPSAGPGDQPGVAAAWFAPRSAPPTPKPPKPASVFDVFDSPDGVDPHALAGIVVVFGARGGLGKTSLAQAIAGTAAARGRRTTLVDADKGQGDQTLLLRLDPSRPVPSAYDTARTGRPGDAFADPGLLNELRGARRDRVSFALVAAPPQSIPGAAAVTTPGVYRSIIDHAARIGDLVVVDTRPVSPAEPSDMAADLIVPLLRAGAWGVGLTDSSIPGLKHLEEVLDYLIEQGVPQDRLMTVINRVPVSANMNMDLLGSRLSHRSHWVGPIYTDDEDVQNRSNAGTVLVDVHTMAHQVEAILHRVCGLEVLTAPPGGEKRRRLFGLLGRGR